MRVGSKKAAAAAVSGLLVLVTAIWVVASIQVTTFDSETHVNAEHWYEREGAWQFTVMHLLVLLIGGLSITAVWLGMAGRKAPAYGAAGGALLLALAWTAGCLRVLS